jgi:predicted flavoprotein YhiN
MSRALQKASGVLTSYRLDLLALQMSDVTTEAPNKQMSDVTTEALNKQMIMSFSNEKAMKVSNFVRDSLYRTLSYHQVKVKGKVTPKQACVALRGLGG